MHSDCNGSDNRLASVVVLSRMLFYRPEQFQSQLVLSTRIQHCGPHMVAVSFVLSYLLIGTTRTFTHKVKLSNFQTSCTT
jgi:hypothetical protein